MYTRNKKHRIKISQASPTTFPLLPPCTVAFKKNNLPGVTNYFSAAPAMYCGEKEFGLNLDGSLLSCVAHIATCITADLAKRAKSGIGGWFGGGGDAGKK
jgi:hypothetical protein